MRKLWKTKEDSRLIELLPNHTRREIALEMGFSVQTVKAAVKRLKLKFVKKDKYRISDEEKQFIRESVEKGERVSDIALRLKRSIYSVNVICSKEKIRSIRSPRKWTKEEIDSLIKLTKENPDISAIKLSNFIERAPNVISTKLIELGIFTKRVSSMRESRFLAESNQKRCSKCLEIKDLSFFHTCCGRYKSHCRICLNKSAQKRHKSLSTNDDLNRFIKYKLSGAKYRAKSKGFGFDLTLEFLLELYYKQEGKCFYTKKDLDIHINSDSALSIDRMDSSKGYLQGNVVFCRAVVNNLKQDLTISKFLALCKEISDNS